MGSMNKVILIGNLGRDPELKMTPGGQALCRFSIATTESWKDAQGQRQSKTEWHNIVAWGKQAEVAEKYLRKGQQVMVEGRLQYREYQDQQGNKKTATDIRLDNMVMLGGGEGRGGREEEPQAPPAAAPQGAGYDDDIPF
jgi:single-strand DNA-binding protein